MSLTLAFDVYGTLIDTSGVIRSLEQLVGERASLLSETWRNKQLEYSFRRGLMQNYRDFSVCTSQALDFSCAKLGIDLSSAAKAELLAQYRTLPAFPDVQKSLPGLKESGHRLFAFSNGLAGDVHQLLEHAGIEGWFDGVVSCDEIGSFKPNPAVYAHFLRRAHAGGAEAWLISGNPFDVIGAVSAGMRAAWVRRSPSAVFDPWEIEPTATIPNLNDLHRAIDESPAST
ncbi:MAG: haloacid dehalogenase type II [Desulfuromonadales bacterium]|nr:haloacid dehalogenase type II [Desulfuromonadales bacterium]NIR33085.1 haloacid dehalogenase type II [Desulfuromonadales bacterium]NIS39323.1 haloacid dehalogenase type II [Desulfuromonadales bacterium]